MLLQHLAVLLKRLKGCSGKLGKHTSADYQGHLVTSAIVQQHPASTFHANDTVGKFLDLVALFQSLPILLQQM